MRAKSCGWRLELSGTALGKSGRGAGIDLATACIAACLGIDRNLRSGHGLAKRSADAVEQFVSRAKVGCSVALGIESKDSIDPLEGGAQCIEPVDQCLAILRRSCIDCRAELAETVRRWPLCGEPFEVLAGELPEARVVEQRHARQRGEEIADPGQRFARRLSPDEPIFVELWVDVCPAFFKQRSEQPGGLDQEAELLRKGRGAHQVDREPKVAGPPGLGGDLADNLAPVGFFAAGPIDADRTFER